MFEDVIAFGKYSVEVVKNGVETPIIVANELSPVLAKFEDLVIKYDSGEEKDETIVKLWNNETHTLIKCYNSVTDR